MVIIIVMMIQPPSLLCLGHRHRSENEDVIIVIVVAKVMVKVVINVGSFIVETAVMCSFRDDPVPNRFELSPFCGGGERRGPKQSQKAKLDSKIAP